MLIILSDIGLIFMPKLHYDVGFGQANNLVKN